MFGRTNIRPVKNGLTVTVLTCGSEYSNNKPHELFKAERLHFLSLSVVTEQKRPLYLDYTLVTHRIL